MSILIKGMEMDEFSDYGDDCQILIGTGQAVELPLHGRLIDGDRAEKELAFDYAYAAAKMVKEMPTIIPADDPKEE